MANKFNKDQIAEDAVNDTHIDWGTGVNQVSAGDMPIADAGGFYLSEDVEGALQEIAGGGGGGNGKILISSHDTTSDYLENKLVDDGGTTITKLSAGGNEQLQISSHSEGADNQNLWETISSDSGSATAGAEDDTLTVAGGDGTDTEITDKTLSINISADGVKDYHVDWGTGENQVSLDDVPDGLIRILGAGGSGLVNIDSTDPVSPDEGELFLNSSDNELKIFYLGQWNILHSFTFPYIRILENGDIRILENGDTRITEA